MHCEEQRLINPNSAERGTPSSFGAKVRPFRSMRPRASTKQFRVERWLVICRSFSIVRPKLCRFTVALLILLILLILLRPQFVSLSGDLAVDDRRFGALSRRCHRSSVTYLLALSALYHRVSLQSPHHSRLINC
jgi:hypothetical protein